MNWQDITKPFSLTQAVQTNDSPWDKGYTRIASSVSPLSTYISIPQNITNDVGYHRRLMFQYNYTNDFDFYITNITQLMNFAAWYLADGCVCVKWRVGETVYRYRILDYRSDYNWSFFPLYTNQKVKKNFVIEFWEDNNGLAGITQDIALKTDRIAIPSTIDDGDFIIPLNPALPLASLTQPFPLLYPIDYSRQAYLDNI